LIGSANLNDCILKASKEKTKTSVCFLRAGLFYFILSLFDPLPQGR
jgi:hypothetical protein